MQWWELLLLCAGGFIGSWFGVVTGGSGFITTYMMILMGLPPDHAVANTRFSIISVDIAAIKEFHAAGKIHYRLALPLAVVSGLSALGAALYLKKIEADDLKRIIGGCMLLAVVLSLAFPKMGAAAGRLRTGTWSWAAGVPLTAVSTALATVSGGAAGIFYSYILVLLFGETFLESAGTRKIIAFALTISAATTFACEGRVDYAIALPLLVSSGVGGWMGSRFMLKRGDKAVRWVFLIGVAVVAGLLLFT